MKTTFTVTLDVSNPDDLARALDVLAQLADAAPVVHGFEADVPAAVPPAEAPKRGRGRPKGSRNKAPADDASAPADDAPPFDNIPAPAHAPAPAPAPAPKAEGPGEAELRDAIRELVQKNKIEHVYATFQKFGATALSEVKAKDYAAALAALKAGL